MAVNLDALPKDKPEQEVKLLPSVGFHKAVIKDAKEHESTNKPGNFSLKVDLQLDTGEIITDYIADSDSAAMQYKMARFIRATKLPLTGSITLCDLAKVVVGKQLVVDIKHQEETYKDKKYNKAVINMFENDVFYQIEEFDALNPTDGTPFMTEAEEAADSNAATTGGTY